MRWTVASSVSWALWTLAERSATTINDWEGGVVCSSNPASAPVSRTTIRIRSPREVGARRGESGGVWRRQMTMIAASATRPAPKKMGRVRSKPTMERQPLDHDHAERDQCDPWPDLELAAPGHMCCRGVRGRRKGEAFDWLELRGLLGKEIDCEPRLLDLSRDGLLDRVQAHQSGIAERGDRPSGQRATAAVRPHDSDGGGARRRDYGDRLVGMEAVAGHARWQDPPAQVLHQDWERHPQRQIRVVQVETEQGLPERLVADEDQRRLQAGD